MKTWGSKNYSKCNFIKVLAPLCRSLPYLLTQTKLRRTKQPHKHQNRSKYVTRPDKVTNLGMDFFIYGRNFFGDQPTWGGNLGPKLYPSGGFFRSWFFIILKNSHQDLSNEGSNFILSSLEVGHWVAQT